jgi:hypothetical protein
MKNVHLRHPEDSICSGKFAVLETLDWFERAGGSCSVKYDGAPAVVYGYNPENGEFFVGTKSVFNKVKVKINYTHTDIEKNHGNNPKVANILHLLLECAPRDTDTITQADFIGYTGEKIYKPNVITYEINMYGSRAAMILAAHTKYYGDSIKNLTAVPLDNNFTNGGRVHFVNTFSAFKPQRNEAINFYIKIARILANFVKYPTRNDATQMQLDINKCIKTGDDFSTVLKGNQLRLFKLMIHIKELLMDEVILTTQNIKAKIVAPDGEYEGHEGYVHSNEFGVYKLVNRRVFSHFNFTLTKGW